MNLAKKGRLVILRRVGAVFLAFLTMAQPSVAADLLQTSGKLSFLRVHQLGSKYGPPQDQIDAEVVVKFTNQSDKAFGFQLRENAQGPAHRAMLDILRDAFENDWPVTIDYLIDPGKKNGLILRVWVTK